MELPNFRHNLLMLKTEMHTVLNMFIYANETDVFDIAKIFKLIEYLSMLEKNTLFLVSKIRNSISHFKNETTINEYNTFLNDEVYNFLNYVSRTKGEMSIHRELLIRNLVN